MCRLLGFGLYHWTMHRSRLLYLIRKLYIVGKSQLGGNLLINTAVFLKECPTVCQTESFRLSLYVRILGSWFYLVYIVLVAAGK